MPSKAGQQKGGRVSAARRRAKGLAKLAGLTPMQIYRKGYQAGWHKGLQSAASENQIIWRAINNILV